MASITITGIQASVVMVWVVFALLSLLLGADVLQQLNEKAEVRDVE